MATARNVTIVKNHQNFVKFYMWGFEGALGPLPRAKIYTFEIQDGGSAKYRIAKYH